MVVALGFADLARDGPFGALKRVHADDGGEQRCPHHLAASRSLAFLQCRKDAERAVHPRQQVRDRHPDALHIRWRGTGYRHQPGFTLGDLVIPGARRLWAVVTEPADGQHHQSRVDLRQSLLRKPKSVKDTGTKVLHQHVCPADQRPQRSPARLVLEVEGDGLLVSVRAKEVGGLTIAVLRLDEWGPPPAGVVAAVRVLDLDHVGAEVAEHHCRVRPGQGAGQVDNHQTV